MLILLLLLFITHLSAAEIIQPPSQTHGMIRRHRKFMQGGNFTEPIRALAAGLHPNAARQAQHLARQELNILRKLFHGFTASPKHQHLMREVIRNRLNPQLRDQFIQKAEHYRETHPRISSSERARLIVGLRTTIAEHKAHEPRDPTEKDAHHAAYDAVLAEVDAILGDNNPTSFEAFTDRHGSSIGLGLYHAGDAALQMVAENERADAFSAKTPHEVWEGTAPPNTRLSYGIEAARHGINATYGLIPLVSWQGYNDASKHSLASKIMGAGHLIARVSNVLHKWTRGESPLSGKTAHSLSYYNRRFGPTSAAKDLNAASRKLGRMRLALRLLGQGLIPGMSAYHYDKHKHLGNYTSPGLASANVTGLIDSIMDICWRIYRMRKIAEIKASASKMEHTLSTAPPTQSEKARDQYVAGVLRDDEF